MKNNNNNNDQLNHSGFKSQSKELYYNFLVAKALQIFQGALLELSESVSQSDISETWKKKIYKINQAMQFFEREKQIEPFMSKHFKKLATVYRSRAKDGGSRKDSPQKNNDSSIFNPSSFAPSLEQNDRIDELFEEGHDPNMLAWGPDGMQTIESVTHHGFTNKTTAFSNGILKSNHKGHKLKSSSNNFGDSLSEFSQGFMSKVEQKGQRNMQKKTSDGQKNIDNFMPSLNRNENQIAQSSPPGSIFSPVMVSRGGQIGYNYF